MASAQVVQTCVTNNSPSQDSNHPDYLSFSIKVSSSSLATPDAWQNPSSRMLHLGQSSCCLKENFSGSCIRKDIIALRIPDLAFDAM